MYKLTNQGSARWMARVVLMAATSWSAAVGLAQAESTADRPGLSSEARDAVLRYSGPGYASRATEAALGRDVKPDGALPAGDGVKPKALLRDVAQIIQCENVALRFAPGSASLSPEQEAELLSVSRCLQNTSAHALWVVGQTDTSGSEASNWRLAMDRARAVVQFLRTQGVPARRLVAVSAGETGKRMVTFDLAPQKAIDSIRQ